MKPIIWSPSPNWSQRSRPIRYIVMHTTQGTNSLGWLCNPASVVSAHYLVQEDQVFQLVDEDNAAWHAGIIVGTPTTPLYDGTNPNEESIGIEMEGFAATNLSPTLIATTVELIRDIERRRGYLPLVSHSELSPGNRSDPGTHNRAALEVALGNEDVVTDQQFIEMYTRLVQPGVDNTVEAIKKRLEIDAHHSHNTSEPKQ